MLTNIAFVCVSARDLDCRLFVANMACTIFQVKVKRKKKVSDGANGGIIKVQASEESSYYLFANGEVRACGRNDEGQLGDGTFVNTNKQQPVTSVKLSAQILDLGSGPSSQSIFFITDGDVYGAGKNDRYQLGIEKIGSEEGPKRVLFDGTVEIARISSSGSHTVAMGYTILTTFAPTWVSSTSLWSSVGIPLLDVGANTCEYAY